jgi:hypothetical protein
VVVEKVNAIVPFRRLHAALPEEAAWLPGHARSARRSSLRVSAQATFTALAALLSQVRVELFPTVETGNRNHEVVAGITDQTFHLALVVTLAGRPNLSANS